MSIFIICWVIWYLLGGYNVHDIDDVVNVSKIACTQKGTYTHWIRACGSKVDRIIVYFLMNLLYQSIYLSIHQTENLCMHELLFFILSSQSLYCYVYGHIFWRLIESYWCNLSYCLNFSYFWSKILFTAWIFFFFLEGKKSILEFIQYWWMKIKAFDVGYWIGGDNMDHLGILWYFWRLMVVILKGWSQITSCFWGRGGRGGG